MEHRKHRDRIHFQEVVVDHSLELTHAEMHNKSLVTSLQEQMLAKDIDLGPKNADGVWGAFTAAGLKKFDQAPELKREMLANARKAADEHKADVKNPSFDNSPGMTEALRRDRSRYLDELKNPKLLDEILAASHLETGDKQAFTESLINRASMGNEKGEPISVYEALHNGFYGPVNQGGLPGEIKKLTSADREGFKHDLKAVLDGSNKVGLATDQGLRGGIHGQAWQVSGEWYGNHTGSKHWVQEKVKEAAAISNSLSPAPVHVDPELATNKQVARGRMASMSASPPI